MRVRREEIFDAPVALAQLKRRDDALKRLVHRVAVRALDCRAQNVADARRKRPRRLRLVAILFDLHGDAVRELDRAEDRLEALVPRRKAARERALEGRDRLARADADELREDLLVDVLGGFRVAGVEVTRGCITGSRRVVTCETEAAQLEWRYVLAVFGVVIVKFGAGLS